MTYGSYGATTDGRRFRSPDLAKAFDGGLPRGCYLDLKRRRVEYFLQPPPPLRQETVVVHVSSQILRVLTLK